MPNMQEHAWERVLAAVTERGIAADLRYAEEVKADQEKNLALRMQKILAICGEDFDPNNSWQLGVVLFEKLRLRPVYRTKSTYRVDNEHLKEIDHDVIEHILAYRAATRNLHSIADYQRLAISGRIHPHFSIAPIGRVYASQPNIQSMPRDLRRIIVPDADCALIAADWRAAQLRLLANLAGDPELVRLFGGDADPFVALAAMLFGCRPDAITAHERASAKRATYALLYGGTCASVASDCELPEADVKRYWTAFWGRFRETDRWISGTTESARKYGYVRTIGGRCLDLPENRKGPLRNGTIVNWAIQGSEADILLETITQVAEALRPISGSLVIPLHDELVVQAPVYKMQNAVAKVRRAMTGVRAEFVVPMSVRVMCGSNWGDLHDC